MTTNTDETAYLELIADRFEFLAALDGDDLDKRELTETLPFSRSTVDRAIRDLSAAGLVVSTRSGYTASLKGRYLTTLYENYRRDVGDVLEMDAAISTETGQYPLPIEALLGATMATSTAQIPHRPLQFISERIDRTDHATVALPRLPNQMLTEEFIEWLSAGHACRLVVPESILTDIWREYPELVECIQSAPEFDIRVGPVPPYGLTYSVTDNVAYSMTIMYEKGRIQSVIGNDTDDAVEWARTYTQSLWERARPFDLGGHLGTRPEADSPDETGAERAVETSPDTEAVPRHSPDSSGEASDDARVATTTSDHSGTQGFSTSTHSTHSPLPTELQSQGFVRLSPDYFDRVGVSPPLACWRTGFDLGEVRVGYALDRERPTDDGREHVTDELFDSLTRASDRVVVGPPGSGKSTVCMSVACRWYDEQRGPVIYRKSGHRNAFDATAGLASYLTSAPGHALVVIEDATRAEANAVFELVREFADDDRVTFLLDSRKNEWQTDHLVGAAQLESHRTHAITEYAVPPVDARERERLVEHFESTVDQRVDIDPDGFHVGDGDTTPGEMYLFLHRLARHVEPTASERASPTSLLDDIDSVYEDLRDAGDLAVDVGVLVNLLNAAGVHVDIPLAYALATDLDDESLVETALDQLERSVLYPALEDDGAGPVRTVHETWSAQFLHRLCELESPRQARRRFERSLDALYSLVDDEQARTAVQSMFGGTADVIRTIKDDPEEWGNTLVKNVFELGVNNPTLSSLFAESDYANVDVPRTCDASLALDVRRWRARMFVNAGDLDRAMREFESLSTLDEASFETELSADALVGARADGLAGMSEVLQKRGEYGDARDAAESALEQFDRLGDDVGRSDVLNGLGAIESRHGNFELAKQHYETALQLRRAAADETRVASTLSNLAATERSLNEYDTAVAHATESLETRREIGYRWGEAVSLEVLGLIEIETGQLDNASQHLSASLTIRREIGDSLGAMNSLNNLGRIEFEKGRIEDAHARYAALVEQVKDEDVCWLRGNAHYGFAEVLLERGESVAAFEHTERALDDIQNEFQQVELQAIQALAKLDCGELDTAHELATNVFERAQSLGGEQQVYAGIALGRTLAATGSESRALETLSQAVEVAPNDLLKGRALVTLGEVQRSLGSHHDALTSFEDAVSYFSAAEARGRVRKTATQALELADELEADESELALEEYTNF